MKTIRDLLTHEQRRTLRKMKTVDILTKQILYAGLEGVVGANEFVYQFRTDLNLYGMYEALLYVEGYETDGVKSGYKQGTAQKAALSALGITEFTSDTPVPKQPAPFTVGAVVQHTAQLQAKRKTVTITEDRFIEATEGYEGWCIVCQDFTTDSCEPDACCRKCDNCGQETVYGAEEALMQGNITF